MSKNKVVLVILDGWGIGPDYPGNAIINAKTPTIDMISHAFPHTQLEASGESVGLPHGESGNSETGHLNIGAGRIVYQDLPRINMSIANGNFFDNKAFTKAIKHTRKHSSNLHLLGLIGQGGVHSVNEHLYALIRLAKNANLKEVYLHLITDGRDSPPTSASTYLAQVQAEIKEIGIGKISTIMGRYYAMDRDQRYERTRVAYDALIDRVGEKSHDLLATVQTRYSQDQNDEFLTPIILDKTAIQSNDAVIFYNYRIDRPRQLTRTLLLDDPKLAKHSNSKVFSRSNQPTNLLFVTMTEYEKDLPTEIAFSPEYIDMPLSRVIALAGKRQLKMSESEKERFITYYFNGQHELAFPGEDIDITPSPKVATYDLQPEMSGRKQTDKLLHAIRSNLYDLIVINYPNPDMVAHTGNYQASVKTCEFIDSWIKELYQEVMRHDNLSMIITADHGNVEELINLKTGEVDTEHSNFPVPLYLVSKKYHNTTKRLKTGILGDIAPTILKILGLKKPTSMTGRSLL